MQRIRVFTGRFKISVVLSSRKFFEFSMNLSISVLFKDVYS